MARQNKTLPARRQNATNDSLLIRSAESLGRMIGALQRQVDAARQVTSRANGAAFKENGRRPVRQRTLPDARTASEVSTALEAPKTQRKTTSTRAAANGSTHVRADRTSKRAAKSAAAKQTGGRRRSGAKQRARRRSGGS